MFRLKADATQWRAARADLGLLASVMVFLVDFIISNASFTLDTSKWFFADSLLVLLIPISMACYGFYASRGGEPLLGRRLLD